MKHLLIQETFDPTNLYSPWVVLADKIYYSVDESTPVGPNNNEIWYTANEKLPQDISSGIFGVTILSHDFSDGKGIITFDGDVTSIGEGAFDGYTDLISIEIPNSVTDIDEYAFVGCYGLTSVTIPDSVTSISNHAFERCSGLTSIDIPNSVTSIGNYAFEDCSGLTSVTYDGTVYTSASALTSALKNNGVSVRNNAFAGTGLAE